MKQLWLVRHGESTAQQAKKHDPDPHLSKRGVEQAKRLVEPLKGIVFDQIWISPLRRVRQTVDLSRVRGAHLAFDSRLIECPFDVNYAQLLPYATPGTKIGPFALSRGGTISRFIANICATMRESISG